MITVAYQDLFGKPGCQPQDDYYCRTRQTKGEAAADRGLVPAKHEAKTAIPVPQPRRGGGARAKPYVNEWQQYGLTDCILGAQRLRGFGASPASGSQFMVDCGRCGCNVDGHAHHWPTIGRPCTPVVGQLHVLLMQGRQVMAKRGRRGRWCIHLGCM